MAKAIGTRRTGASAGSGDWWRSGRKRDRLDIPVTVVGRFYKPSGCTCVLPAWELCEPNCKHGLPVPWDPLEDAKRFNTDFR